MKPEQALEVPGNTPWERLDSAVRKVFSVSKHTVLKKAARAKRVRQRKLASMKRR